MSDEMEKPAPPPRRHRLRRWLKRIGLGILALLLLLAIFHRPLFFEGTRYFVVRAAKQQHLDLTYDMSGSIFTTLSISNLKAVPTEPGPVQRLEISNINLQYSLTDLIRDGLPAFLKTVEVRNAYIEVTPGEPLPPEKKKEPQAFKFPALFPKVLNIENVNLLVRAETGNTEVAGLFFSLLPDKPGVLKVQTLDIPGVRKWTDISGVTTYRDRNLVLTELAIGPEIQLTRFNLDASKLDEQQLGVALEGSFFKAPTALSLQVADLNNTNRLDLRMECTALSFDAVWNYLQIPGPLHGTLDHLKVSFQGAPEQPATWFTDTYASLSGLALDKQPLGGVTFTAKLTSGRGKIDLLNPWNDLSQLTVQADVALAEKLSDIAKSAVQGQLAVSSLNLSSLPLPQVAAGDLALKSDFQIHEGKLTADTMLDSHSLTVAAVDATETHLTARIEKDLTEKPEEPPFHALATNVKVSMGALRAEDYVVDSIDASLSTNDENVTLDNVTIAKGANTLQLKADYLLPADMKSWETQPTHFDLAINAPDLSAFVAADAQTKLKGSLQVTGKGEARDNVYNGNFSIAGKDIAFNDLPVRTIDAQLQVVNNEARLSQLALVLNDQNTIRGGGVVQLAEPFVYQGSLDVQLTDLSLFQPLVGTGKDAPALAGSLIARWKGGGDFRAPQHTGDAGFDLTNGQFGDQKNLSAHTTANYSAQYINVPDFQVSAGKLGNATFSIFWKDDRLQITNLKVDQQKLTLLEGSIDLPLRLTDQKHPIPGDQPIKVSLQTKDLNLRTLFMQMGQEKPPVVGTVNLNITADGTLAQLAARTDLKATGLQSTAAEEFDPAAISLEINLREKRLLLNGSVTQKLIQPLRLTGDIPFDAAAIAEKKALDPKTPLKFNVSMPSSSLLFLSTLVPAIRQSRGTAQIDVNVGGTIDDPDLKGAIQADLSALRFADPSLPPINNFGLRINFTDNRMSIDRCAGGIAGGTFGASGTVNFANLNNPVFDLRLGSRNALAMQNDDMTARVTSDLRITGPMNAGSVTGNVYITRSVFFKTIDVLPIGLPGRPAPQPPPEPTVISFPKPPLKDWKFDVAIRTADPFLIQSNLADGRLSFGLRLGGTGEHPWVDGGIRIETLTASLPFSRLNIASGSIYFTQDQPFIPQLNLRGTSRIRDYDVSVYISGPVTNPQAVFSSNPPLPESDVVSLLATGMTTSELTKDPNAIAGRAAILVFQKLYNSIFRRDRPPTQSESFLNRIQFDVGITDPKTGRQAARIGIPLSDQLMLVGGLDVGGNFNGQIKYLIRFK